MPPKIALAEVKLVDSRFFAEVTGMDCWGNDRGGGRGAGFQRDDSGRDGWRGRAGDSGRMTGIEINTRDVSRAERVDSGAMEEVLSTTMKTGLGAEVTSAGWTRLMSAA